MFGANGEVGGAPVRLAADAGHALQSFLRTPETLDNHDLESIQAVRTDATDAENVDRTVEGTDVVTSFLGSSNSNPRSIYIMDAATDCILTAAAAQPEPRAA